MQLSEVVEEHPSLIPVINRFGIRLGLGDKSVQFICEKQALDPDFFLTMINTFLNEDYFPEKKLQSFHTSLLVDYLTQTNHYYQRSQLPNIERHLNYFISMSTPENSSLKVIRKFFYSFKDELLKRIAKDEKIWFPYCLSLSEKLKDITLPVFHKEEEGKTEDPIEALLADLKSIMIKHLTGEYDENLCYAVIVSINTLEKDIRQHNRIRYRILEPIVWGMEHS
ncbi:helix-turn-helix transcriptional regulator [Parabacteroides sp. Marseille-P3160]|uniref:helix-turn-helix transcriptional regulator n=1 Tax=Parabacteroides sp. Marseille-P3160 TaxID=1917887 RepID=UPI0009B9D690|nr:helix-turn-helix transcriptional regulator [Parabacteroides sp. Marseille-P3160]